jgi:DNA-binding transcriptional regulator YhcF (GntR family)
LKVKKVNAETLGHNPEILNRCETLRMYSEFVEQVKKELRPNMSREELEKVLQKVINYCIGKGILKEYLEKHSTEVRNMLYTKWNWKDYVAVQKEELREELEAKYQTQLQAQIRQVQEQDQEEIRRLREELARKG